MNIADIILIILIAAAFTAAVAVCIRNKKNGKGCGGDCSCCSSCRYGNHDSNIKRRH